MNEKNLEFTIFCIENIAERLNIEPTKAYNLLGEKSNIINDYIVPCYEPLHSQGKEYIVNDIMEIMKIRGVL